MKLAMSLVLAAVVSVGVLQPVSAQVPPIDLCLNIEGIQESVPVGLLREPSGNCIVAPTPTAVPTPMPTSTPTPAPVVVTKVVTVHCEGQYQVMAPYYVPYNYGFNWAVPTLVTRTDGVVTSAVPNHPSCLPPVQPATATPVVVTVEKPVVVTVEKPVAISVAAATPIVRTTSVVRPPSTGDGGLATN